jgi:hypothetical protein
MTTQKLTELTFTEIKCPCCGRHLDKVKLIGEVSISRKCKSCKNNIVTDLLDNKIINNSIDAIENSKDILSPNRFLTNRNPLKDKQRS